MRATIVWHIGMYGMFKKAGIESWKALFHLQHLVYGTKNGVAKILVLPAVYPYCRAIITIWITINL